MNKKSRLKIEAALNYKAVEEFILLPLLLPYQP